MKQPIAIAAFLCFSAYGIPAQSEATPTAPEGATIRLSSPDAMGRHFHWSGPNRFVSENNTLRQAIAFAYGVPQQSVVASPQWEKSAKYVIAFNVPAGNQPLEQVLPLLQTVLTDQFKLQMHREQRLTNVYSLVLGQSELKLKASTEALHPKRASLSAQGPSSARAIPVRNATMDEVVGVIEQVIFNRPVINKTGLTGRYDFDLEWVSPKEARAGAGPDIFTAIQELGLKLEPSQMPMDTIVIDYAEQPVVN